MWPLSAFWAGILRDKNSLRIPKNSFPKNHKHLTGEEGLHLNGAGKYLFPYLVVSIGCWRGRYDARFLLLMPSLCLQYLSESDQRGQFTENHTNDLQLEKECWKRMLKERRHWQLTIKTKTKIKNNHPENTNFQKPFFPSYNQQFISFCPGQGHEEQVLGRDLTLLPAHQGIQDHGLFPGDTDIPYTCIKANQCWPVDQVQGTCCYQGL